MNTLAKTVLLLAIVCFVLSATGADFYNNGPTNGTSNAFFIDVYAVTNSFVTNNGYMTDFTFAEWIQSGATPLTVDWSLGTSSFGSDVASGNASFGVGGSSATLLCTNGSYYNGGTCGGGFGYDVYNSTVGLTWLPLQAGETYWLTLTNATDSFGARDGWDINSGPSLAYHNFIGAVPSESFTIGACIGCGCYRSGPNCGPPPTPEPSSLLLFGSGIVGLLGLLRRGLSV